MVRILFNPSIGGRTFSTKIKYRATLFIQSNTLAAIGYFNDFSTGTQRSVSSNKPDLKLGWFIIRTNLVHLIQYLAKPDIATIHGARILLLSKKIKDNSEIGAAIH